MCSASAVPGAPYFLTCESAFRDPPDLVKIEFEPATGDRTDYSPRRQISYSPFPAQLNIDPMTRYVTYSTYRGPLHAVTVTAIEPLAHVRAPLAIDGVRFADYEVPGK
jgi:hypothetical protein